MPLTADVEQAAEKILKLAAREPRRLSVYHAIGQQVVQLDGGYGKQVFKTLADTLATPGLDEATLRKAVGLAKAVDAGQLDLAELERPEISWRTASGLTTDELTDADRRKLLDQVATGELESTKMGAEIKNLLDRKNADHYSRVQGATRKALAAIKQLQRAKQKGDVAAIEALKLIRTAAR